MRALRCLGVGPVHLVEVPDPFPGPGDILQSGDCQSSIPIISSETFVRREVTYTGSWYYATQDYPGMLEIVALGLLLGNLLTYDIPATEAQGAITDFLASRFGNVVLRW